MLTVVDWWAKKVSDSLFFGMVKRIGKAVREALSQLPYICLCLEGNARPLMFHLSAVCSAALTIWRHICAIYVLICHQRHWNISSIPKEPTHLLIGGPSRVKLVYTLLALDLSLRISRSSKYHFCTTLPCFLLSYVFFSFHWKPSALPQALILTLPPRNFHLALNLSSTALAYLQRHKTEQKNGT